MTTETRINWTVLHEMPIETPEEPEKRLRYDLGGQHWLCFREEDQDDNQVWTNVPVSPGRLRRTLEGRIPVRHIAGNADYIVISQERNGRNLSVLLTAPYREEESQKAAGPPDMAGVMQMGKLQARGETFARWMEETAALKDRFWPEWPPEGGAQPDEEETL